jgi:hypothetical protein
MQGLARLNRVKKEPTKRQAGTWGIRQRLVLVGSVIVALAVVFGTFLYVKRPIPPRLDYLPPFDSWVLFQQFREGPGGRLEWERQYETARDRHRRWVMAACAVLAIGALMMASSLMVPDDRPVRRQARRKEGSKEARKRTGET